MHIGFRELRVADAADSFPLIVLYPTAAVPNPVRFGRVTTPLAADAPVQPGHYPLVLISHGGGGSPYVYWTLAQHLVQQGYVVALPEHPGNNFRDNRLGVTMPTLLGRPRHLCQSADMLFAHPDFTPHLYLDRYAVIGHSMGGYTALAAAGGKPWELNAAGIPQPVPTTSDPRIAALVLLAPATVWFQAPNSLQQVSVPVLMLTAEQDQQTPANHALIVWDGLPDKTLLRHIEVPGAGHYSFLSPFPPDVASPQFPPSQDPFGFDRTVFHRDVLEPQVTCFLLQHLR